MATKQKPSPLVMVDVAFTPEELYQVVNTLYETAGLFPMEKTTSLIIKLEGRLTDHDLPSTLEEYEGHPIDTAFDEYKKTVLVFDNSVDDVEPDELDCE